MRGKKNVRLSQVEVARMRIKLKGMRRRLSNMKRGEDNVCLWKKMTVKACKHLSMVIAAIGRRCV